MLSSSVDGHPKGAALIQRHLYQDLQRGGEAGCKTVIRREFRVFL